MQNSPVLISLKQVLIKTYKTEGIRGFYKGMGPPLITIPLINSIVFASYELMKRLLGASPETGFTF
jgi:hypothetical protein